jgi:hypothetical protein
MKKQQKKSKKWIQIPREVQSSVIFGFFIADG